MIRHIKLLRNIGTFNSDSNIASLRLGNIILIHGENGRGKTTLAAVLRSLVTGEATPINERRRLGSSHPPHMIFECEGDPSIVKFEDEAWNRTLSELKIFDDLFVDQNVYSGLDVASKHRQNLHEVILGDQGVTLNRRLGGLVEDVREHNAKLQTISGTIPTHVRCDFSIDEFCALREIDNVESEIRHAEREWEAALNEGKIRTASPFLEIELPEIDIDNLRQVLMSDLPELDAAAAERVYSHLKSLGGDGESWLADGINRMKQSNELTCPFCGQNLDGLRLVEHYRAYFSENYEALKKKIAEVQKDINEVHSSNAQLEFQRALTKCKDNQRFWSQYCDIGPIDTVPEEILQAWTSVREMVSSQMETKLAAPLERQELSEDLGVALKSYNDCRQTIKELCDRLLSANDLISDVKRRVQAGEPDEIKVKLNKLRASKARFSFEWASLCDSYLEEKRDKVKTETTRDKTRTELEHYRTAIFPELQDGVNAYLERFNAGFRLDKLAPGNIGSGSGATCTYNLVINDVPIEVRREVDPSGTPSFRNAMSAGDRSTLALAFFFSSLDQNSKLSETVVVIDDPISSLDEHRARTTVQEVRKLVNRSKQLIVLSHNKRFLCNIWEKVRSQDCVPLEIIRDGDHSKLQEWDVTQDAWTEHDYRHELLKQCAASTSSSSREAAQAIRMHLEGYLRVACPADFQPGRPLGQFVDNCRQGLNRGEAILNAKMTQELEELIEYANLFHHDTNRASRTAQINATELSGFVRRTLKFTGPLR